jgi:nuclear pore complex protein Nup85
LAVFPTEFSKSITSGKFFLEVSQKTPTKFFSMTGPVSPQTCKKKLYTISWERTLYNPFVRKLVNESCGAFTSLQIKAGTDGQISSSELIKSSHQYRCIMNACIEDLNQAADLANSVESNQALQEMSEIFYKAELVWNLCEILYLENPLGILPHLLEWIRIHFPNAVRID